MSIIERVREKKREILADAEEARRNRDKAVAAVHAGIHSKAWKTYMAQFAENPAENPKELMRLMATDGTLGSDEMDIKRAYLVANAVCGSTTTTELDRQVETIDNGL